MTRSEQRKAAHLMGRLAAFRGKAHLTPDLPDNLMSEWRRGVSEECKAMHERAAGIPLLFKDET